jgi:hypothetical protein
MEEKLAFLKVKKQPNIKQANGVPLNISLLQTANDDGKTFDQSSKNVSIKERDILLEKILRNKEQAGLVITEITTKPDVLEVDENAKYQPIDTNETTPQPPPPALKKNNKQVFKPNLTPINEAPSIPTTNNETPETDETTASPPSLPPLPPPQPEKKTKKQRITIKPPATVPDESTNIEQNKEKQKPPKKRILVIKPLRPIVNLQKELVDRLPPSKKSKSVILKTSRFYLNNRKMFLKNFDDIFKKYKKEIEEAEKENVSCDSRTETRELFIHQRIVKDYLNLHTPYRGLLLYHGLGSGKTCTSIAIAEGMKVPDKRIYVLTPASLKMNYFSELKKCGDDLYKKKQFWEFVSVVGQPDYLSILSNTLSIPEEYITKNGGAWLVNVKKPPNFESLSSEQQKDIDNQLNIMIRTKYTDINYNGLNQRKMEELTEDYSINPFDNSVVIVDEAHNFVSRIVTSLKKLGKKQPTTKSINLTLYNYLMDAMNVRIVFLSGTPIINYPNEIAVLYNILRGFIKTWTFQLTVGEGVKEKVNKETILGFFDKSGFKTFDYVEYSGNKLTVTRNPFGFVNSKKTAVSKTKKVTAKPGIKPVPAPTETEESQAGVEASQLEASQLEASQLEASQLEELQLEASQLEESQAGLEASTTKPKKNTTRRKKTVVPPPPPPPATIIGGGVEDEYNGIYLGELDEQGNISDEVFQRTIVDILLKHGLYVTPNGITTTNNKCLPDNEDDFFTTFVNMAETKMNNEDVFKRRILGLTSYFRSSQERLLPRFIPSIQTTTPDDKQATLSSVYHMVYCPMSNFQFTQYVNIREKEILQEKNALKQKTMNEKKGNVFIENSTYRVYSREVCNFAFPDPPGRPFFSTILKPDGGEEAKEIDAIEPEHDINEDEDDEFEELPTGLKKTHMAQIHKALDTINTPDYLGETALGEYSPKFAEFLRIFSSGLGGNAPEDDDVDTKGCHLLYSSFRTIEGIGILRLVLINNGYEEFKIRKNTASGEWEIVGDFSNSATYKRFVLYTGTETAEEKEIVRNIYNGDWDLVPSSISSVLRQGAGYTNNMFGEVIRLFMITASGSEGINLRNTRFVHIIEPYWNLTRAEQIIGRASRICSHASLPEEYRTVKVYMYISTFNEEKTIEDEHSTTGEKKSQVEVIKADPTIGPKETSRLDDNAKITTDESLLEISVIKNRINSQILKAVKETAIDCRLYEKAHAGEGLKCYDGFGVVKSNNFGSFPTIQQDVGERMEQNVKETETRLVAVKIKGEPYKMNMSTNEVFKQIGTGKSKELVLVGKMTQKIGANNKKEYIIEPA